MCYEDDMDGVVSLSTASFYIGVLKLNVNCR